MGANGKNESVKEELIGTALCTSQQNNPHPSPIQLSQLLFNLCQSLTDRSFENYKPRLGLGHKPSCNVSMSDV